MIRIVVLEERAIETVTETVTERGREVVTEEAMTPHGSTTATEAAGDTEEEGSTTTGGMTVADTIAMIATTVPATRAEATTKGTRGEATIVPATTATTTSTVVEVEEGTRITEREAEAQLAITMAAEGAEKEGKSCHYVLVLCFALPH